MSMCQIVSFYPWRSGGAHPSAEPHTSDTIAWVAISETASVCNKPIASRHAPLKYRSGLVAEYVSLSKRLIISLNDWSLRLFTDLTRSSTADCERQNGAQWTELTRCVFDPSSVALVLTWPPYCDLSGYGTWKHTGSVFGSTTEYGVL